MFNKQELVEILRVYPFYTEAQKKVLKCLLELELKYKVKIDVTTLSKKAGVNKTSIYNAFKKFENDGVIYLPEPSRKNVIFFKEEGLEDIVQTFKKLIHFDNSKII